MSLTRHQAEHLAELLDEECSRAMAHMRIPRHPKPYFLSYALRHEEEHRVEAKFGALTIDAAEVRRTCFADVRVGSYRRDQVRSGGLKDNNTEVESYELTRLPFAGHDDGFRFALWRLTEAKYREACDDYLHRRAMELNYRDEHAELPSFEKRDAVREVVWRKQPNFDRDEARRFVLQTSSALKRLAQIRDAHVRVSTVKSTHVFVSSEGSRVVQTSAYQVVEVHLWYLSKEGVGHPHTRTWFVRDPRDLPSATDVRKEATRLHQRAQQLAAAPVLRAYNGPVLLDPKPAGLMIHEALGHRLEGNRLLAEGEGQTFRDSIGEAIVLDGLDVFDDPTMSHFEGQSLAGHYLYDDEGVLAQRANLITDGQVRGFLTSRAPVSKRHRSNGHARTSWYQRPISRMGVTVMEAKEGLDDEALWQRFLQEIRRRKAPYGIRILEAFGGETTTESYDFQAFLGEVDYATRVFPDGREEVIRGIDFVGTPLNAVAGIVAAGSRREVDNSWCGAESGYVPVSTITPSLLVDELELQAKPQRQMTPHAYPIPWDRSGEAK